MSARETLDLSPALFSPASAPVGSIFRVKDTALEVEAELEAALGVSVEAVEDHRVALGLVGLADRPGLR
jgi:hypothetical protein